MIQQAHIIVYSLRYLCFCLITIRLFHSILFFICISNDQGQILVCLFALLVLFCFVSPQGSWSHKENFPVGSSFQRESMWFPIVTSCFPHKVSIHNKNPKLTPYKQTNVCYPIFTVIRDSVYMYNLKWYSWLSFLLNFCIYCSV